MQIIDELEVLCENQRACKEGENDHLHPHHHHLHACISPCNAGSPSGSCTPPEAAQHTSSELSGRVPASPLPHSCYWNGMWSAALSFMLWSPFLLQCSHFFLICPFTYTVQYFLSILFCLIAILALFLISSVYFQNLTSWCDLSSFTLLPYFNLSIYLYFCIEPHTVLFFLLIPFFPVVFSAHHNHYFCCSDLQERIMLEWSVIT